MKSTTQEKHPVMYTAAFGMAGLLAFIIFLPLWLPMLFFILMFFVNVGK